MVRNETAAMTTNTGRQLPSNAGKRIGLVTASAMAVPRAGEETPRPVGNRRSSASNNEATSLGVAIETKGPPIPNTATAANKLTGPFAMLRSRSDAVMVRLPTSNDHRNPRRSTTAPPRTAVNT